MSETKDDLIKFAKSGGPKLVGLDLGNTGVVTALRSRESQFVAPWTPGEGFDLVAHLERQRQFSFQTFGPGARTKGVIDHIRKELIEIEAAPRDLGEWIDVALLAFDGAWRAGHAPEAIADAFAARQARNEARAWPDWRTADPDKAIEHKREA